jgi:hypothetical protein
VDSGDRLPDDQGGLEMKSKTPFKDDLVRFAEWCKKISDETLAKGEKQDGKNDKKKSKPDDQS